MSPEEVVERLVQSAAGEIVACNIIDGIREQLIDRHFARNVLEWLGRLVPHLGSSRSEDLVDAIAMVRDKDYPAGLRDAASPDFRMKGCPASSKRKADGELSCVMAASTLRQLIDPADVDRLRAAGLPFPVQDQSPITLETIADWRERPADERQVRFNRHASLGRPGAVVWFTRRDCLPQAQRQNDRHRAQRARDVLGLVHYADGVVLAALHIPARVLQSLPFSRPTFLDAANHARFKTWPDGARARRRRTWGFTADLAKVASDKGNVDGCAEQVTRTIPGTSLAPLGTFEVELLGAVTNATDNGVEADRAFAKRLRGTLTVERLACTLRTQFSQAEGTA